MIFSHSSAWAICQSARNVRDDILRRVKENDGVVMVNFFKGYINCDENAKLIPNTNVDHVSVDLCISI